ncbi:ABC transporter substrate-binding protein [Microbacterium sp. HD4P20]|uniref:ABC transporter substrate-binding protein n=1 Tax=Microbacterium sp. HD4P20 TaxID=2864874 RepID=UPI0020A4D6AD|nr:ABC transporter substrate-binding protein [Microbacterium sp. HD4P20]MCP2636053.1 ABC transporter substrate-binding protein [Microbacterium sp. HD4P20]
MRFMRSRAIVFALTASVAIGLAGCAAESESGDDGGDQVEVLKLVLLQSYDTGATIQHGIDEGYFAEVDLELDITETDAPPTVVSAVASGQYDIGQFNPAVAVSVLAGGVDIRALAAGGRSQESGVQGVVSLADSGIEDWADLAGQTVGVQAPRAAATLAMLEQVRLAGGDPSTVELVAVPGPQMLSTLESGGVDAAVMLGSFLAEATTTNPDIVNLGDAFTETFGQGALVDMLYTSAQTATDKADALERFRTALARAYDDMNGLDGDEWKAAIGASIGLDEEQWEYLSWVKYDAELSADEIVPYADAQASQGWIEDDVDLETFVSSAP